MGNKQEHDTNRHYQVKCWSPSFRNNLPVNYTVKDELRLVAKMMVYDTLKEAYEEEAKIQWGWRKLGLCFPENKKEMLKIINCLSDKEAEFLKESYRYPVGDAKDPIDAEYWDNR